ncbi:cytidine deaminase [Cysteiniphilum litorale]|uniref:cytidine deaminase n=1 Tax=Cysteiniphilum litorale TaxID=2056700 RepID=UPI003F881AC0
MHEINEVFRKLQVLKKRAYAPYSNFSVAAMVELKNGDVHEGVNVENASFPVGSCAEMVAINAAVASGARKGDFKAIYVTADAKEPVTPCGACRQVMAEFFDKDVAVHLFNQDGTEHKQYSIDHLLPERFCL